MRLFLHLLRHDLRTHRSLLLVWLAVLALHPLSSLLLQWFEPTAPSAHATTGLLVMLARIASTAIIVGVLIQTDGPSTDTAFWRTRPVPARVLAAQKLSLVYALFLLLPAAIVIATAVVAGVPVGDLGWMLGQVLVADALFVGACVVAAAATTRPSTTLLTLLLGAVIVWFGSFGIAEVTRLLGVRASVPLASMTGPAVGFTVLSAIGILLVAVTWKLYAVGRDGRIHVTSAAFVIVVALAMAAQIVQPARGARPGDDAIQLTLDTSRLRADTIEGQGVTQVLVSAPASVSGLRSDERAQVWPHDATLRTPAGETLVARTDQIVRSPDVTDTGLYRWPALAVLAQDKAAALKGVPLDYTGSFTVEVLRRGREPLGRTAFVPGIRLAAGPYQLRVDALRNADSSGESTLADVTVLQMTPWFPGYTWTRPEWYLVDRSSGRRVRVYLMTAHIPPSFETLLPTLAPPFVWATMELRRGSGTRLSANSTLDADLELLDIGRPRYLRRDVTIEGLRIP